MCGPMDEGVGVDLDALAMALGKKDVHILTLERQIALLRRQNAELTELAERQVSKPQQREDGEDDQ